jgi:flagellar protein FliO/FliZ
MHLIGNVALMLLVTLVAIFVLMFLLKHFKKIVPKFPGNLQVLGGTNLGGKSRVVLIEAYDKQLLVGVSDSSIQTLYVFDKNIHPRADNQLTQKDAPK